MSSKVKVFNDNVHDFKSNFKGDPVFIKAKSYWLEENGEPRVMDLYEANDFRGDYHPIKLDGQNLPDPTSFKMIKLEKVGEAVTMETHVCNVCKHKSPSSHELDAHVKFTHANLATISIPEEDAKPKRARA